MTTVFMKEGDRLPALRMQLLDSTGAPIDLTAASSVTFRMRNSSGALVAMAGTATIITAATGYVQYAWGAGDTGAVGGYVAEWVCDFSGLALTVPTNGYVTVQVVDALGV